MYARVTFTPRNGTGHQIADVRIDRDEWAGEVSYSATNLTLWGCGKSSTTWQGAVHALVQDMATIVEMKKY